MTTVAPTPITADWRPEYANEEGVDTYAFPSSLRPDQKHYVHSEDGGPWVISPAMPEDGMTIDDSLDFVFEMQALRVFAQSLQGRRSLRRPAEVDERLREMDQ